MKQIIGKYAKADIFTDNVEDYALAQIRMLCNHIAFEDCIIKVMPDVHPGKVGTIGFTSTVNKKIMINVVGIDIGCGVSMMKTNIKKMEHQKLDTVIRDRIPSGFKLRNSVHQYLDNVDLEDLYCINNISSKELNKINLSLGTLGGGNHFIEIDKDEDGYMYITVHSGSRRLGKVVTEYYLDAGKRYLKSIGIDVPYELTYLEGDLMNMYIRDMMIVEEFAKWNRYAIIYEIIKGMNIKSGELYNSTHNYIGDDNILRKGAISAYENQTVIIPINMKDGIILGAGKGNEDYNYSAPHGAGRILRRDEVKNNHTLSEYKKIMKGIHSPSINKNTLDEAPFAYRSIDQILPYIEDTVKIDKILKPWYNFKADGKE